MDGYKCIILVFGILTLFILIILYFVNQLLFYRNKVNNSFRAVNEILDERIRIIDGIINFIKKELKNEDNLVNKLNKLRIEYDSYYNDIKYIKKTNKYLNEFKRLSSVYINLKSKSLYRELNIKINNNQDKMNYAMEGYDKEVKSYNDYCDGKFISVIQELFKFPHYDYYNNR